MHQFYVDLIRENEVEITVPNKMLEKYRSFIPLYVRLKQVVKASQVSLAAFKSVDETNPKLSIVMSLLPLVDIASKEEFNCDDVDLIKALDEKKLVSINAKDISNELLESITYALFTQFSKRSMLMNVQPISVFIDEAQRVLSKNQDLNLAVLRECKVEMFLAYQNSELMENKLGGNEYKALMKNLTSSFYYSNLSYYKESDLSGLRSFECLMSKDDYSKSHRLEPIYIDKKELYIVENIYLNNRDVFQAYGLEASKKSCVLLFDGILYQENKIIVYDIDRKISSIETIIAPHDIKSIEDEIQIFSTMIEEEETNNLFEDDFMRDYFDEELESSDEMQEHDISSEKDHILLQVDDVIKKKDAA